MSVELIDSMGSDLTVVNAARVSFANRRDAIGGGDERLIKFLAREGHWSPFAHCMATFHVTAPMFAATQLKRHQVGLAVNEVSRRYVDEPPEFVALDWRARAPNKKQGSAGPLHRLAAKTADTLYTEACRRAAKTYRDLLELGVAPEQARAVLPTSTTTQWYWTGSLAAWARVCHQRLAPNSQVETQEVARQIADAMAKLFPLSWVALMDENRSG